MTTSNLQARLRAMADKMRDRHLRYEGVKGDYIYAHNVDEWAAELDALLREAAAHVSRERGMDETADALTLLRQLVAPCEPISFDKDEWRAGDHKWRDCRRCMALHALDLRFDLSMRLLNVAIKALASSAVPPERDPLVNLRAAKYLNPECYQKATVSGSQGEGVGHCALAPLPEAVAPSEHRAYCPKSGDISGLRVCTCGTDVASLRAQLAAIQQRLGCVAELHISRVCELGTSGCAVKHDLRAQLAEAQKERDAEAKRVDIVIAEFDAPWPHSHTVGEVVSGSLAWKIHECRRIVEDARVAAEHRTAGSQPR